MILHSVRLANGRTRELTPREILRLLTLSCSRSLVHAFESTLSHSRFRAVLLWRFPRRLPRQWVLVVVKIVLDGKVPTPLHGLHRLHMRHSSTAIHKQAP